MGVRSSAEMLASVGVAGPNPRLVSGSHLTSGSGVVNSRRTVSHRGQTNYPIIKKIITLICCVSPGTGLITPLIAVSLVVIKTTREGRAAARSNLPAATPDPASREVTVTQPQP